MKSPQKILERYFGYQTFRSTQEEIITRIVRGENSIVIMPTGMGKSLCYQIPALIFDGLTLVISPLISLMKDQVDGLTKRGIDATYINSSLSKSERLFRYESLKSEKYKILYVTPERFRKDDFLSIISLRKISLLVVDEAHCISEWGHDFRPDYTRIEEFRNYIGNPTTIALTATATPLVQNDIIRNLGLVTDQIKIFHEGIERSNLSLKVESVYGEQAKVLKILEIIDAIGSENGIIYFSLIKSLISISEILHQKRIPHILYHGELDKRKRKSIQFQFMEGENNLVLATSAFGMGIDKNNIRFVIHAEIPSSLEAYYQEIGRAGRDGIASSCILLYDEEDLQIQMEFIEWRNPSADYYERAYSLLETDIQKINAYGIDYLKEHLTFKSKRDHRISTVLNIFDRYKITSGSLDEKNLKLEKEIEYHLLDQEILTEKKINEQKKLLAMVNYTKLDNCLMQKIHAYFGLILKNNCGNCQYCSEH